MMEIRRATLGAAIRLAIVFSAIAALVAMTLDAIGDISIVGMVAVVSIVGFTTSWVQTGRVARTFTSPSRRAAHVRVATVCRPIS